MAAYVEQDNVPAGRELLIPDITYQDEVAWAEHRPPIPYVSHRDVMIAVLISAGIPRKRISEKFNISMTTLRKIIQRLKRKLE